MSYIPRLISVSRTICPKTGVHYLDGVSDMGSVWCLELSPDKEGNITPGEKSWKQLKLPPERLR